MRRIKTDNDCSNVYGRIRALRNTLNLSQVKFAAAIHISNGYLAEIELGHCKINERIITLVAVTFDANKHWIETGEGEMFKQKEGNMTPEQRTKRMTELFDELHPDFQDYILEQINKLVSIQNKPRVLIK
jgi:transcriptional regulator with XRE-family HTH domain